MYPPADGCSVTEAFSLEPFSQGNNLEDFEGFGSKSYESVIKQPNINEPSVNPVKQLPNMLNDPMQQQPREQQPQPREQQPQPREQPRPRQQQPRENINVHRDIHIVNNRPTNRPSNRHRPINRPLHMNIPRRPVVNNTYVNKTKYVRHPRRKQNNDNNWMWIIIGILIFLNIVLSVMYVRK